MLKFLMIEGDVDVSAIFVGGHVFYDVIRQWQRSEADKSNGSVNVGDVAT